MALFGYLRSAGERTPNALGCERRSDPARAREIKPRTLNNGMPGLCERMGLEAGPVVIDDDSEILAERTELSLRECSGCGTGFHYSSR